MSKDDEKKEAYAASVRLIDADRLHSRMVHIGHFLVIFEMLRSTIIENTANFFANEIYIENGNLTSPESESYKESVRSLADKKFEASLKWLEKMEAISSEDTEKSLRLLAYRNQIAHKSHEMIFSFYDPFDLNATDHVEYLFKKIGNFWAVTYAETDPFIDLSNVNLDELQLVTTKFMTRLREAAKKHTG